jgi:multiple sugar transport system permease protein
MYHAELGVINDLLKKAGVIQEGVAWLGTPSLVIHALVVIAVWRHLPFAALVISAAVQAIPASLLEAATIDGANAWQRFRHVVLPALSYTMTIIGILTLISSMNDLVTVWGSTRGGPANASEILSTYIYQVGFTSFRFGLSSALSVINFLILLTASIGYLIVLRKTWRA